MRQKLVSHRAIISVLDYDHQILSRLFTVKLKLGQKCLLVIGYGPPSGKPIII